MADRRTLVGTALALLVLATVPIAMTAPVGADPSYDDDPGPCPGEPDNEGVDMNNDGYINLTECAPIAPSFGGEDASLVAVDSGGKVYVGGEFDTSTVSVDGARIGRQTQRRHTEPPVDDVATVGGRKAVQPRDLAFLTPDGRIDVSKVERARENGRKTVKARDA